MSLLNPAAFYWLGLAGIILLLYFLRQRERTHQVSALFLWEQVQESTRSAFNLLKVRRNLLLFIQLLILALLVLGLANPTLLRDREETFWAILIDGSASMGARAEDGTTRYERAVNQAIELIEAGAPHQLMAVQVSARSRLLAPLTEEVPEVVDRLRDSRLTFEGDGRISEAIELINSQRDIGEFERILFLTDRPVGDLPFETIRIGGSERNVAITAFNVRRAPEEGSGTSVFAVVSNYTDEYVNTELEVRVGGEAIVQAITLPPRERQAYFFPYVDSGSQEFVAAIDVDDDLPEDNVRYFTLLQELQGEVLWIGEENRFLREAIEVSGGFRIRTSVDPDFYETYDLIVVHRAALPEPIGGNLLLVNATLPPLITPVEMLEVGEGPLELPEGEHSILNNVEVNDIRIARLLDYQLPETGRTLIASEGHPVLYLLETGGMRLALLGFDLYDSNILLTVDFPILIGNILRWLSPEIVYQSLEVGDALPLDGLNPSVVTGPDDQVHLVEAEDAFLYTELPGFYRIRTGEEQGQGRGLQLLSFAVNIPVSESDLRVESGPGTGVGANIGGRFVGGRKVEQRTVLWRYLALGGLVLLLIEFSYYDRSLFRLRSKTETKAQGSIGGGGK
ncbi:MAG: VWA domain-containing protein [Candidatus Bipolaricaulia bacterium]